MKKTLLLILLILLGNLSNLSAQQVTLSASASTIVENGSTTITATLNAPTDKDVTIKFESSGSAFYYTDFINDTPNLIGTFDLGAYQNPVSVFVDSNGNINFGWDSAQAGMISPINLEGNINSPVMWVGGDFSLTVKWDCVIDNSGATYAVHAGFIKKWEPGNVSPFEGIIIAGGYNKGSGANQLDVPAGLFVDSGGNIYVADSNNHRIQKWEPGATSGITVAGDNGAGNASNQLSSPFAVHVDSEGNVYVADTGNSRIQKWTPGASSGTTIISAIAATDIFLNDSGDIYLAEPSNNRILKITQGSNVGVVVAGGNGAGNAANQLSNPLRFFVDSSGSIYIADYGNNRIQKYQYLFQIVIPAGQTSAQLIINGIEDNLDENKETILLQPSVTNATLVDNTPITLTIADLPILAPTNVSINAIPRKVRLNWMASTSSNLANYKIYRGTSPNPTTEIATISSSLLTYDDTTITTGITYYYRITSVRASGLESDYSSDINVIPTNNWYVATIGSDNSFGSAAYPFQTIQYAISQSKNGDVIKVNSGIYQELLFLDGTNSSIKIESVSGPEKTILSMPIGAETLITLIDNTSPVSSKFEINGFTLKNTLPSSPSKQAFEFYRTEAVVKNVIVYGFQLAILMNTASLDVQNGVFYNNGAFIVNNNAFIPNPKISISQSTIVDVSGVLINSNNSLMNYDIKNSIIVRSQNNSTYYFQTIKKPLLTNVLVDMLLPTVDSNSIFAVVTNAQSIDFVDLANKNFRLSNVSPAIGSGSINPNIPLLDLEGNPRPNPIGTNPDMGAYENVLGMPTNKTPTLDQVSELNINESAPQQTINLSGISDGDILATQNITITATSNNTALIPNPTINYSSNATTGTLQFTPVAGGSGTAIITITVQDDGGILNGGINTTVKTFTVNVAYVNKAPIANSQPVVTLEDTNATITLTGSDVEGSALNYSITTLPASGVLYQTPDGTSLGSPITSVPTIVTNANKKVIYKPSLNQNGLNLGNFQFETNDGLLNSVTPAAISVDVTAVNDIPLSITQTITTNEDTNSVITLSGTDVENSSLSFYINTLPTNGLLYQTLDGITKTNAITASNTLVTNVDGKIIFEPVLNGNGDNYGNFNFKSNDGLIDGLPSIITVNVTAINDAPTGINISGNSVPENLNNQIIGNLSTNDVDLTDTFTYELVSGTGDTDNSLFTISGNQLKNNVVFDFEIQSAYSVRIKSTDSAGTSTETVFSITVANVNDIAIASVIKNTYCDGANASGTINITVNQTNGDVSYLWAGPNGFSSTQKDISNLSQGTYTVTVTDSNYSKSQEIFVGTSPIYSGLDLCYVTSDATDFTKNRINLSFSSSYNVYKFQILREGAVSGIFDVIGEVNATDSSYLDLTAVNSASSYKYRVRTKDLCGNTSNMSASHKTILLQSSIATNSNVNLSWTPYEGVTYGTYIIYRKVNTGPFEVLTSIASTNLSYVDINANTTLNNYSYYVSIDVNSCPANLLTGKIANTGSAVEIRSNQKIISKGSSVAIASKVLLQGPYITSTGLMNDDLRNRGLIPITSPYKDAAKTVSTVFNLGGTSNSGLAQNDIVDWVWVELRDKNNNTVTIESKSALLQRDGDIVDVDGISALPFNSIADNYYLMISHRNHLGILSASTVSLSGTTAIDFTTNSLLVSGGTNGIATMGNGKLALFSGDFNGDGQVQNTDKNAVEPLRGLSGYSNADINMNSEVQNADINSSLNPNIGKGEQFSGKRLFAKRKEPAKNN